MNKTQIFGLILFVNAKVLLLIYAISDPDLILLLVSFGLSMSGIVFLFAGAE